MRKAATTLFILSVAASLVPLTPAIILKAQAATSSVPSQFMEISTTYASATISFPPIGNVTTMTITPVTQDKSSTTNNYTVLSIVLSSNLRTEFAASFAAASISTNLNPDDVSWRKALSNGSSTYTEINGVVTINNLFQTTLNELKVQKIANRITVDFNPLNPIAVTLPRSQFPAGDFPATWAVPSFHVDFDPNGSLTLGNSTFTNPSGWKEYNEYAVVPANYTFNCPTWSNFNTSGTGSLRRFNIHRGQAPGNAALPTSLSKTTEMSNSGGATFTLPTIGGINRMRVIAIHALQGTLGTTDILLLTLSATGSSETAVAHIMTNSAPEALAFSRSVYNGTSTYTQVGNNVSINNLFQVPVGDLRVQPSGNNLTVDFTPSTPLAITLPADKFPPANFSATWIVPAFHMEISNTSSIVIVISGVKTAYPSGWNETEGRVQISASSSTCTFPSMNLTASGASTWRGPYLAAVFESNTEVSIPEGSTLGVMLLMPLLAVAVGLRHVRKLQRRNPNRV